jgi:hypothetical protein
MMPKLLRTLDKIAYCLCHYLAGTTAMAEIKNGTKRLMNSDVSSV